MTQFFPTRRALLAGSGALALAGPALAASGGATGRRALFGAAVRGDALAKDAAYAQALAARCQTLVPEGGLKWPVIRPTRDAFVFDEADRIAAFAARNGLALRGHTLAWYAGMPAWAEAITARAEAERVLTQHIERGLVDAGVPIHGVGIQAHLMADRTIDRDGLQSFLGAIRAMGLDVLVTELDVIDYSLPGPVEQRDARVAETAQTFLSAVAEVMPPSAILTWGISDRYTWVPMYFTRRDGMPNRPLPLDADMRPKPLMAVIERFTRSAS